MAAGSSRMVTAFEEKSSPTARRSWDERRSTRTGDSRPISTFRKISAACTTSPSPMRGGRWRRAASRSRRPSKSIRPKDRSARSIELRVTGFGWRTMESTWVVNWDNQEVGYVSADRHAWHGGRAVPRDRPRRRSRDQGLHGLHGPELPESRAGAKRVSAAAPVRRFASRRARRTSGGYVEPYQPQKMPAAEVARGGRRPAASRRRRDR